MNKTILCFALIFTMGAVLLTAQSADSPGLKPIIQNYAARDYASGAVTKAELDLIVQAGIRAPSARNQQPWHFTVVQDQALAKRVLSQTTDGNVLIIVSAEGDGKTNGAAILDCGFAVQSIYLAAQALGLGSRIYTGPIEAINKNFKTELSFPKNHSAVALIRIGRLKPGADAVSSASARSSVSQKVTYK